MAVYKIAKDRKRQNKLKQKYMTRILLILHVYSLSQANKEETVPVLSAALEMIHCSFFQPEKKR